MRDRLIQLVCAVIFVVGATMSGFAVPKLLEQANKELQETLFETQTELE